MKPGAAGARIAQRDWRRSPDLAYGVACALLFAGGIWFRFSAPLWPLVEPDTWAYLWPALSGIEGDAFTHAGGRAFPYPLFLWALLKTFGDFRAIVVAQYMLGLGTGAMALVAWHAVGRLADPQARLWLLHRLLGLCVLFGCLYFLAGVGFERSILPETLFTFAMASSAALLLLAVEACRDRAGSRAAVLLGVALAVSLATLAIKPHWLLAAGATAVIVPLVGAAARIGWRAIAVAVVVPVLLFVLGFMLPERRLAETYDRAGARLFLPQTLVCWHLEAALPALREQAAAPDATDDFRRFAGEIDTVLKAEVLANPGWYAALGYDADKCMYGSFSTVVGNHFAGDPDRVAAFYWQAFTRGLLAHPGAYALKVLRELRGALGSTLPFYAFTMPVSQAVAIGRTVTGQSPMFDRAVAALAAGDEPKRRKLQNLSLLFYRPLALATNKLYVPLGALALAGAAWATLRRGRAAGGDAWRFAPLLGLVVLQLGTNLTIALSHSHAVLRYRMVQYPLTYLLVATALLVLAGLALQYWRAYRGSRRQ